MRKRIGFMCGTDFNIEAEDHNATVFATTDMLKTKQPCWEECGIVKVSVEVVEEIYRGKTITGE